MNAYSELLRYIQTIAKPLVNTVTQGDFTAVDLEKKNIFSLVHVAVGNASFPSDGVIRFDIQIGCFDIRDINKDINADKYFSNDNEVDNLNSTMAVLNRLWLLMLKDFEENDITASDNPTLEQYTNSHKNLIDGWIMSFQADVPNTVINLCQ